MDTDRPIRSHHRVALYAAVSMDTIGLYLRTLDIVFLLMLVAYSLLSFIASSLSLFVYLI